MTRHVVIPSRHIFLPVFDAASEIAAWLKRFAELRGRILVCVASRAYHIDMLVAVANAAAPGEELGVWVARWRENLEAMRAKISTRGAQLAMF